MGVDQYLISSVFLYHLYSSLTLTLHLFAFSFIENMTLQTVWVQPSKFVVRKALTSEEK